MSAETGFMALWDANTNLTDIVPSSRILVGLALDEVDDFPRAALARTGGDVSESSDADVEVWQGQLQVWFKTHAEGDAARPTIYHALKKKRTSTGYQILIQPGPVIQEEKAWQYLFTLTMKGSL